MYNFVLLKNQITKFKSKIKITESRKVTTQNRNWTRYIDALVYAFIHYTVFYYTVYVLTFHNNVNVAEWLRRRTWNSFYNFYQLTDLSVCSFALPIGILHMLYAYEDGKLSLKEACHLKKL